jgi:hypothetical protein
MEAWLTERRGFLASAPRVHGAHRAAAAAGSRVLWSTRGIVGLSC